MSDLLPIPHFQQSADGYCLAACARMVLAYLGIKRSEAQVRKGLGAEEWGTPTFAIQRLASAKLEVIYREWSITELLSAHPQNMLVNAMQSTKYRRYLKNEPGTNQHPSSQLYFLVQHPAVVFQALQERAAGSSCFT